jgi:hypothetical protein
LNSEVQDISSVAESAECAVKHKQRGTEKALKIQRLSVLFSEFERAVQVRWSRGGKMGDTIGAPAVR